jgi:erythronate-4-phosphate dehydrogenase
MKIVVDENMPYVQPLFGALGDIVAVDGRRLTPQLVSDADILLVRSVTRVDEALLAGAFRLKFVGSATIGTDHVDLDYLGRRGIPFGNAPGCNATAVGEFAFIAMLELAARFASPLKGKRVGIVGAGNTGSALAKCLMAYGVEVLLCDPIKQAQGDPRCFVDLETLHSLCDVVSLHVPITRSGAHQTWHLFDEAKLNSLKPNAWLLNCCRGEVIDNAALIDFKARRPDVKLVLDVWEGEPHPMEALVPLVEFATPHIAGYSLEGRARGTFMLYRQVCQLLKLPAGLSMTPLLPRFDIARLCLEGPPDEPGLLRLARLVYDLRDDDARFRACFNTPTGFDRMRKNHQHRREFSALTLAHEGQTEVNWLSKLGFSGVGH